MCGAQHSWAPPADPFGERPAFFQTVDERIQPAELHAQHCARAKAQRTGDIDPARHARTLQRTLRGHAGRSGDADAILYALQFGNKGVRPHIEALCGRIPRAGGRRRIRCLGVLTGPPVIRRRRGGRRDGRAGRGPAHQIGGAAVKPPRERFQIGQGEVDPTLLDIADVGVGEATAVGQLALGVPTRLAQASQVLREPRENRVRPRIRRRRGLRGARPQIQGLCGRVGARAEK